MILQVLAPGAAKVNNPFSQGLSSMKNPNGFGSVLEQVQSEEFLTPVQKQDESGEMEGREAEFLLLLNGLMFEQIPDHSVDVNGTDKGEEHDKAVTLFDFLSDRVEKLTVSKGNNQSIKEMLSSIKEITNRSSLMMPSGLIPLDQWQNVKDISGLTGNPDLEKVFLTTFLLMNGLEKVDDQFRRQFKLMESSIKQSVLPSVSELDYLIQNVEERVQKDTPKPPSSSPLFSKLTPDLKNLTNTYETTLKTEETSMVNNQQASSIGAPMSKVEQYVLHLGQGEKGQEAEKLTKDFQQILSRSVLTQNSQQTKLTIKLYPEHLGAVHIELLKNEHGMTAKFVASTQQAKELLESQLSSLKQAFIHQNVQVDKIEIQQIQPLDQSLNHLLKDGSREQEKQQKEDERKDEEQSESNFAASFEEVLLNLNI
ncbi:flagellar hook-length control protein FliK [Bacillus songklensis]|uniref:Flagellar hook-length control protein FliK n=1 Tax=Bacillus songklensis TaxID=1069116 RepID=A0ABV8B017_9BACI